MAFPLLPPTVRQVGKNSQFSPDLPKRLIYSLVETVAKFSSLVFSLKIDLLNLADAVSFLKMRLLNLAGIISGWNSPLQT
jgi:hypothetical protein